MVQALWFTVLLPGHTRGAIVLPGTDDRSAVSSHGCCGESAPPRDPRDPMPAKRVANCAVCFFAAHLSTSLSIPPQLPLHERCGIARDSATTQAVELTVLVTYLGRAPPIVNA